MDNLPIIPEQNLEQPVAPPSSKINPMLIIGGVIIIALILTGGIFIGKYLNTSQNIPVKEITPTPTLYPSPTVTSIPNPTANWKTYVDSTNIFSFKYPAEYFLGNYSPSDPSSPTLLNNHIDWTVNNFSRMSCRGDCPMVTDNKKVTVGTMTATKITGWVGSVGGEIPQSYITYEFRNPDKNKYIDITLWELLRGKSAMSMDYAPNRNPQPIAEADISTFNQILSTFKFLDVTGKSCQSDVDCGSGYRCMVVAGNVPVDENGKEIIPPKTCYPTDAPLPQ